MEFRMGSIGIRKEVEDDKAREATGDRPGRNRHARPVESPEADRKRNDLAKAGAKRLHRATQDEKRPPAHDASKALKG